MNSISDQDLEQLEGLLDNALAPPEAEHLRRRLAAEPALAEALGRVRAERDVRRLVWHAGEPTDLDAAAFADRWTRAARRHERWRRLARLSAFAAAAAACFVAGWMGNHLAPRGGPAPLTRSHHATAADPAAATAAAFQVVLTDETGNVLAVQKFAALEEARRFAGDLSRWQVQQQQVRQGQAVLISDQF